MIQITNKSQCCGCTACVSICPKGCITMKEDNEGFLFPKVDISVCINCNLCQKVCPVLHQNEKRKPLVVYAAKNEKEEIRKKSSSGGIFTLLAERIIDEGGVVFGARFNEKWEVVHDCTNTYEGLNVFRGSKYVQSCMGDCFSRVKNYLESGRKVLFSGVPCQIAGLKNFLKKEYDNLLTVDIVCHGVPSPKIWKKYLDELTEYGVYKIVSIGFRDKIDSWRNYRFRIRGVETRNSSEHVRDILNERGYDNKYIRSFLYNMSIRESCYSCPVKRGKSCSDITLGDYWGIEKVFPEFDDDKGCSLVLVNTLKGKDFCDKIDCCMKLETSYESAVCENPNIEQSSIKSVNREFYFKHINKSFSFSYDICLNPSFFSRLRRVIYRTLHI